MILLYSVLYLMWSYSRSIFQTDATALKKLYQNKEDKLGNLETVTGGDIQTCSTRVWGWIYTSENNGENWE